jgi:tetratricopeptide (TPR) repeat protein
LVHKELLDLANELAFVINSMDLVDAPKLSIDSFAKVAKEIRDNPLRYAPFEELQSLGAIEDRTKQQMIQKYTETIRLAPGNAQAYRRRAHFYWMVEKIENQLSDLTEAIRLDPGKAVDLCNRGGAYESVGDYKKAIVDYNASIALTPNDPGCYSYRASAWFKDGSYENAVDDLTEALRIASNLDEFPSSILAHWHLSRSESYLIRVASTD